MIKIALFGCGRIGRIHLSNLLNHPSVQVAGLVDAFNPDTNSLCERWHIPKVTEDEVFSDAAIDGIFIASASNSHYELIEKGLNTGKHIFCEKPLDADIERVRKLIPKINQSKKVFSVGFNRRFDKSISDLKKQLDAGTIGNLENLTITSRDPAPPPIEYIKVSGGMYNDMTVHDFDLARWLVGEEMKEVYAVGDVKVDSKIGEAGDIDSSVVVMKSKSGVLIQIINSRRAVYGYDQRLEAFGEKGMLQVKNQLEGSLMCSTGADIRGDKPMLFFLERYEKAYKRELEHFVEAIEKEEPVLVDHNDGLKSMELAELALKSLQTGLPVKL